MPTVFNAANECAVARFLAGKIGFLDIAYMIKNIMEKHTVIENPDIDTIIGLGDEIFKEYM